MSHSKIDCVVHKLGEIQLHNPSSASQRRHLLHDIPLSSTFTTSTSTSTSTSTVVKGKWNDDNASEKKQKKKKNKETTTAASTAFATAVVPAPSTPSKGMRYLLKLLEELQVVHSTEVEFGAACHHWKPLPFDILVVIQGRMGLIEYDGRQHFEHGNTFTRTKEDLINQQTRDVLKTLFTKKHSISLLRISYDASEKEMKGCLLQFLEHLNHSSSAISGTPTINPLYLFSNPHLYAEHQSVCQLPP